MHYTDHPLTGFLDTVAAGQRPSDRDIEALLEDVTRSELGAGNVGRETLRRQLETTIEQILDAHQAGDLGHARRTAKDTAQSLVDDALPAYHRPDPDAGRDLRDVVADIPRGF